jgi:signal transduction histidine kinase
MEKKHSQLFSAFYGEHLSFRVKIFNVIGVTGIGLSLMSAVNGILSLNPVLIISSFVAAIAALALICIFTFTSFKLSVKIITVTVVFCTVFPLLFFEVGSFGMIIFVLGVLFSSVLFERKKNAAIICIALVLYYSAIIVIAHFPPFSYEELNALSLREQLITFVLVCAAISITVTWLVDAYEREAKKLRVINEEKIEFLSNFSHELKTPLTSIKGFAQYGQTIILNPSDDLNDDKAETLKSFESIISSAEHLDRMGTQLLDTTMIEQGIIRVNLAPCSFFDIAERVRCNFSTSSTSKNTLEVRSETKIPIIKADPDKLIQVLYNLIKNANKHTENGVITLSATFNLGTPQTPGNGGLVKISVKDTGSGIPDELLPFLFKKYPQTEVSGIKTDHGMGLFISKTYIEAMGGEIHLEKTSDAGSEFVITLPVME